jgi:SAM-dependent methyltransferase
MSHEIIDLLYFYRSPIGRLVHTIILKKIGHLWETPPSHLTGIGYCDPFLDIYHATGTHCLALSPSFTGLYARSGIESYPTALIQETCLPLRQESQKNILCNHILEHTSYPDIFLKEIFNCLKPEGEVIFIVANRHGSWARNDNTPFGSGRPYSRKQLTVLLQQAGFIITDYKAVLFFSPNTSFLSPYYTDILETLGSIFISRYSGLHIIRALKRIYVPPMAMKKNDILHIIKDLPQLIPNSKPIREKL